MKTLRKRLLIAAAVAGIGLTTAAFAGPWGGPGPMGGGNFGGGCGMMDGSRGGGPGQRQAMMQQYHAERMELLAARLKLKPEQEGVWKAFLAAQDTHHADKMKGRQEMREMRNRDTTVVAHFEQRVQIMEQRLAGMKAMTKAASDLYTALDADQKQVMDKFFADRPMMMRHGRGPQAMANQPMADAPPPPPTEQPADSDNDE
ncbi:MAG: Spy/CpxP family protein refolding chaperone [Phycisphaerales bacterium]|nr:Spy/CpxP family protein refolding chaperone [Phycisphaerales bacterium]